MQFWWIPPVAIAGFILWWSFIIWLAATLGGWRRLAARFRSEVPTVRDIPWFYRQSVSVGLSNYGGCASIGVSRDGIYLGLRPKLLFPFHPWLFLPWSELEVVRIRDAWLLRVVVLNVGDPALARLQLPLAVLEAAERLKEANP